jgi:hypothetical protein
LIGAFDVECAWGDLAYDATLPTGTSALVLEDLRVPSGKTLKMRPGSTLRFDPFDNSLSGTGVAWMQELVIAGTLRVLGGGPSARFENVSADTAWLGAVVQSGGRLLVDHAEFHGAEYALVTSAGSDSIVVQHSLFSDNEDVDIHIGGTANYLLISENTFEVYEPMSTGVLFGATGGIGNMLVEKNVFLGNASGSWGVWFDRKSGATGSPTISENTFTDFDNSAAIYLDSGKDGSTGWPTPTLTKNIIQNGKIGIEAVSGLPMIGVDGDTTSDNILRGNITAISVKCTGGGTCPSDPHCSQMSVHIRNSRIYSNTYGVVTSKTNKANLGDVFSDGKNQFLNNTGYCIFNKSSTCGNVSARGNYFGVCNGGQVPSCWSGWVDVTGYLCSQPSALEGVGVAPTGSVFRMLGANPNPVLAGTTVHFELPAVSRIEVSVFDVAGRLVRTVLEGELGSGVHEVAWDGMDQRGVAVSDGLYLVRVVRDDHETEAVKLLVAR